MKATLSIEKFGYYLFWFGLYYFAAMIPFQFDFLPASLGLMLAGLGWMLSGLWRNVLKGFAENKPLLIPFGLFVWIVIGLLYSSDINRGLQQLLLWTPLAVLPIFFASIQSRFSDLFGKMASVWAHASVISAIITILFVIWRSMEGDITGKYRELSPYGIIPAHYLALYYHLALVYFLHRVVRIPTKVYPLIYMIILVVAGLLLSIRVQWFALLLFSLFFIAQRSISKQSLGARSKIFIFSLVLILLGSVFVSPELRRRAQETKDELTSMLGYKTEKQSNHRVYLWTYAKEVIAENFWLGTGTGGENKALFDAYQVCDAQFWDGEQNYYLRDKEYNYHNAFLQIWAGNGVIAFLLLLAVFGIFIRKKFEGNRLFTGGLAFFIFLAFFTESMLQRQAGIFIFAFLGTYVLAVKTERSKEDLDDHFIVFYSRYALSYSKKLFSLLQTHAAGIFLIFPIFLIFFDALVSPSMGIVLLGVFTLAHGIYTRKKIPSFHFYLYIPIFYLLVIIHSMFVDQPEFHGRSIEYYSLYVFLPIFVWMNKDYIRRHTRSFLLIFAASAFIAWLIILFYSLGNGDGWNSLYGAKQIRALGGHPSYTSLVYLISALFLVHDAEKNPRNKWTKYLIATLFIAMLIFMGRRMQFVAMLTSFGSLFILLYYRKKTVGYIIAARLLPFAIIVFSLTSISSYGFSRIEKSLNVKEKVHNRTGKRTVIWEVSASLIRQNPWLGTGMMSLSPSVKTESERKIHELLPLIPYEQAVEYVGPKHRCTLLSLYPKEAISPEVQPVYYTRGVDGNCEIITESQSKSKTIYPKAIENKGSESDYEKIADDLQNYLLVHDRSFNAHNQYIQYLTGIGILAILFFFIFFAIGYKLWREKNVIGLCVWIALALSYVTESMLERQAGGITFAIVLSCIFASDERHKI